MYLFDPPRQIICGEAAEFTSHVVQAILQMLNCKLNDTCIEGLAWIVLFFG